MESHKKTLFCLFIIVLTLTAFWDVQHHDFFYIDDGIFITENYRLYEGLTLDNIKWSFTNIYMNYWHPLTWISYMVDMELYGVNPMGFHLNNLLIHIAGSLLLFLCLYRITGSFWNSGITAILFAIHPLHVESVAWIAERKDLLSGFFWTATICAYYFYTQNPKPARYTAVCAVFALALMSKPMVVTLPIILLLIDYWPLNRFSIETRLISRENHKLFIEKIPFLIMSFVCIITTISGQKLANALVSVGSLSIDSRIFNPLISYTLYIMKMFWPVDLTFSYPYQENPLLWKASVCFLFLSVVTFFAIKNIRSHPYIFVGWMWYLISLLPVIGIIQVGPQATSDRYTYIPLTGLFISITWFTRYLIIRYGIRKSLFISAYGIITGCLLILTISQTGLWKDSITYFSHSCTLNPDNDMACYYLADALMEEKEFEQAAVYYRKILEIKPDHVNACNHLGLALTEMGKYDEAKFFLDRAISMNPFFSENYEAMGILFFRQNIFDKASEHFQKAVSLEPDGSNFLNFGITYTRLNDLENAIKTFKKGLDADPCNYNILNELGIVYGLQGDHKNAIANFSKALQIMPGFQKARHNLEIAVKEGEEDHI